MRKVRPAWPSFVPVAELRGADGRGVELNLPTERRAETTFATNGGE